MSLQFQGLYPNNINQFSKNLDETDVTIVKKLFHLSTHEIVKKFAPKAKNQREFFDKYFTGELKKTVLRFVNRLMAEAVPLLGGKEIFTMGRDGYPAKEPVHIVDDRARLRFYIETAWGETRYFPRLWLRGERLDILGQQAEILCNSPAWMLIGSEIFTFEHEVEGQKLRPFLRKRHIAIPKATEETYFNKFLPQIVERYEVVSDGLRIEEVHHPAHFRMTVDGGAKETISMDLKVQYGKHAIPLSPGDNVKVLVEKEKEYIFYKIFRERQSERDVLGVLQRMNSTDKLVNWEFMERQAGLRWLAEHVPVLEEMGIEVVQKKFEDSRPGSELIFETPEIEMEKEDVGDWFDIRAVVNIGGFTIPFIKFKGHILKGKRDYELPDGKVAILPESWFTDYRHLVEIAEEREGETISIRKYQEVVLENARLGAGSLRDSLGGLVQSEGVAEVSIPDGVQAELRVYQKQGYDWLSFLKDHHLGGILADDMGLGKTLQTLSLMQKAKEGGNEMPSLIVMPTSLIYNWGAEAAKFTPDLKILVHTGFNRSKDPKAFAGQDLILTTYGIVRQDLKMLKKFPFYYIILDESQMIKNPSSKTAKAVRELKSAHRLSLTGTPLENSLMDLWSQMTFLNPGLLGTETFFKKYYAQPIEKQQDQRKKDQLKGLIQPFILRRTKQEVATELPPKVEHVHFCEMTEQQQEIYDETKNAYRNYLMDLQKGEFQKKKLNILAGLQKLRQIAIHPGLVEEGEGVGLEESGKYQEFVRLLEEVLSKGAKVLVFSQFVRLLKLLKDDLKSKEITYSYIDGSTRDRQAQVERFQTDSETQVFLISLKAGGVGLNLTAAEYVFILDPWWNPAVEAQAIDRSYRIGQENTVFSYKFITRGSIEEKIVKLQERKSRLSNEIVTMDSDVFKKLELEELQEMLS